MVTPLKYTRSMQNKLIATVLREGHNIRDGMLEY